MNFTVSGNLNYNFEFLFDSTLSSSNFCIFSPVKDHDFFFFCWFFCCCRRLEPRTLASLVCNSVEELGSGGGEEAREADLGVAFG